jgi:hypothetical protein
MAQRLIYIQHTDLHASNNVNTNNSILEHEFFGHARIRNDPANHQIDLVRRRQTILATLTGLLSPFQLIPTKRDHFPIHGVVSKPDAGQERDQIDRHLTRFRR